MKLVALPGLIDLHVHLRDPELTYKEDFYTGSIAAISGGFTTIIDMPNNKNPIFTKKALDEKIRIARKKITCNVGFYFGTNGENLSEFKKVKDKVLGLKVYMNETTGNFLINWEKLEEIFKAWPSSGGPILLHAEGEAIPFAIKVIKKIKKKTHFCHISLEKDLVKILKAKKLGLPITCGVTPHHLFLTKSDVKKLKGFGVMKPPLALKKDQDFLWKHIKDIDVIESDHAPHSLEEKKGKKPIFGVPGLESTLPLLLTKASKGEMSIEDIVRLCYINPKKLLNLKTDSETKIIIDLDYKWTLLNKNLNTKCKWTPFHGRNVTGKIKEVYIKGKLVYKKDKILAKKGTGKIIS